MASLSHAVFEGPVELVRAIFDTAAREDRATALRLVRVCKAARHWVLPILYRAVALDNPAAVRFDAMLAMSSSSALTCHVRELRASCLPNPALLSERCHRLQALSMANHDVHHLAQLRLPALTHLTVAGSLRYCHFDVAAPALGTVTHLRFPDDVPRLAPDALAALPRLTHFACAYQRSKKAQHGALEQCLAAVAAAPALRVALVCVHARGRERERDPPAEDAVGHMPGAHDPRVVVASSAELPHEPRDTSPAYDACWTFAEKKVQDAVKRNVDIAMCTRHLDMN